MLRDLFRAWTGRKQQSSWRTRLVAADLETCKCIHVSVAQAVSGSVGAGHNLFVAGVTIPQSDPMAGLMKSDAEQIDSLRPIAQNYRFIAVVKKRYIPAFS